MLNAKTFHPLGSSSFHFAAICIYRSSGFQVETKENELKCCWTETTTMHKYATKLSVQQIDASQRIRSIACSHIYSRMVFNWFRQKSIACILLRFSTIYMCLCVAIVSARVAKHTFKWNCSVGVAINCDKYNNSNERAAWSIAIERQPTVWCQYELFGQLLFVVIISNKQLKSWLFVMLLLAPFYLQSVTQKLPASQF